MLQLLTTLKGNALTRRLQTCRQHHTKIRKQSPTADVPCEVLISSDVGSSEGTSLAKTCRGPKGPPTAGKEGTVLKIDE